LAALLAVTCGLCALSYPLGAGENLLRDPGFEQHRLDEAKRCFVPTPDASWREITLGVGSVTFDASEWAAPAEMKAERPLGFSPGARRPEGAGPDRNRARIILVQDVVRPDLFETGPLYEAWVWLAGAGKDDETGDDYRDEAGGWEIVFYENTGVSSWKEEQAIERHSAAMDFPNEPKSFVRVSGYGRIPKGAKGCRMRVWASTWWKLVDGVEYDTEVAIDNAHFGLLASPNLLVNGDFEQDTYEGEFRGWQRPAAWPFPSNELEPLDINDIYDVKPHWDHNFDHGPYLPFRGGRWAYGYNTYLRGWREDAFTFSQEVTYDAPPSTPLTLMFYWPQNTAEASKSHQLREIGGRISLVVTYLDGDKLVDKEQFELRWPVASNPNNTCRYDQNAPMAYNPRFRLVPPAGTKRVGLNVSCQAFMPYQDGRSHVTFAVDDFYLGLAESGAGNGG
jgi:hypothetical protein